MKKTVFIVEDDPDISELLTIVIESEGFEVETFPTLHNVENAITKKKPGLVVMDLTIGGKDAADTVRKLKRSKSSAQTPIILVSAKPFLAEIAASSKADDYIEKPFNIKDLTKLLKKYI